jgi:protein-L-isoaspartate(D-aspartate) O-methyltransferase
VPRHLFVPEVSIREAYADEVVVTKRDAHGDPVSSVSAPQMQAFMLEQAELRPGMRCLEIGSGGYNAALMAELVGSRGEVTSVDIDPDIVDRARRCLAVAGYQRVHVVLADAEDGVPGNAPYDVIIVTVAAWDVPPAWTEQLSAGGRIVVPLRIRGLTLSVTLERSGRHLASRTTQPCGFVRMQGAGAHPEQQMRLHGGEIWLSFDDDTDRDPRVFRDVFDGARAAAWSGVVVGQGERVDSFQLWLASAFEGFCLMYVDAIRDSGLVSPAYHASGPCVVDGGSLAYVATRQVGWDAVELGAHAYGPDATRLATDVADQIRLWESRHRSGPSPLIEVFPVDSSEPLPDGMVIGKRHSNVVVSWP